MLPEKLLEIKQLTFCDCRSLKEITIPKSVKKIFSRSFANCEELKRVIVLSDDIKIMKNSFENSNEIEEISFNLLIKLSLEQQVNIISNQINKSIIKDEVVDLIKKKPKLKKELLFSCDLKAISFVLELGYKYDLTFISECIKYYIDKDETIITAVFLEYKNSKFTPKQIEVYEENKLLVEIGFENPTIKQLTEKWKVSYDGNKNIKISGYKGNDTHEIIPKETADGRKIVSVTGKNQTLGTISHLTINAQLDVIEEEAFEYNSTIEEITLPDSITTINKGAFQECASLKKINLPSSLKSIKNSESMFYNCKSLTSIEFPDKIKVIPETMFLNCSNLENVKLPKNLITIGDGAFKNCTKLLDKDGFLILNSVLFDVQNKEKILIIPKGVKEISRCAVSLTVSLEELVIPDCVEKIGEDAFGDTRSLRKITLNNHKIDVHNTAFSYSKKLIDENGFLIINDILVAYYKPNAKTDIHSGNHKKSNEAPSIEIPEYVKFIVGGVFDEYSRLKLILPKSLEYIAPNTLETIKKGNFEIIIPPDIALEKQVVKKLEEYKNLI